MSSQEKTPLPVDREPTVGSLEELLRASESIEAPMDDRMLLGRVKLSKKTLLSMEKKQKGPNKRFKRNRVKKVGRPKTHHLTKKKLKKANNRRNYLKQTKPKIAARKREECRQPRRASSQHRGLDTGQDGI